MFHLISVSNNLLDENKKKDLKNLFPFEVKIIENTIFENRKKFGVKLRPIYFY